MGPLSFASGSQSFPALRHLSISDDSERLIQEAMERERFPYVQEPFALGDVSFHYGSRSIARRRISATARAGS